MREALAAPQRQAAERRRAANEVFFRPGTATDRALRLVYELIALPFIPSVAVAMDVKPRAPLEARLDVMPEPTLKFSIVIATYNRAADLRDTLKSLAGLQPDGPWEVIVVDNNSPDDTRAVVWKPRPSFPAPLRYLFEREQGRSPALNCGIRAAAGDIIVTTDDDVRVPADWLNRAAEGLARLELRLRRRPRAADLGRPAPGLAAQTTAASSGRSSRCSTTAPSRSSSGRACRSASTWRSARRAFDRAGGFDPHTGRRAGTLLGQEVREWCIRARQAGVRGCYVPEHGARAHHSRPIG